MPRHRGFIAAMSSSLVLFACVPRGAAATGRLRFLGAAVSVPALRTPAAREGGGARRSTGFVQLPVALQGAHPWCHARLSQQASPAHRAKCPATRRGLVGAGNGGKSEERMSAALRALWKIRGSAIENDSTSLKAAAASTSEEPEEQISFDEDNEPSSLLPASAYDDLPPLPNAIGQQQSRDYADNAEVYEFDGAKRAGTVTIIGAPNAGKSTLLNNLVGSKIAIVTHKRQTTRTSITGIAMEEGTQVVYIDTPGIMAPRPKERLNKAMVKSAWNSARDADQIFFIVDADKVIPGGMGPGRTGRKVETLVHPVAPERLRFRKDTNEELIMRRLQERNQRYNLILNKVDQLREDRKTLLLPLAEELRRCAGVLPSSPLSYLACCPCACLHCSAASVERLMLMRLSLLLSHAPSTCSP
jgi:GTP-binding protein EngB required for normal cell division